MLLAALNRLEALMRADGTALERLRDELRLLLIAIRHARPDIDAASPLTKAAKLASLLDLMQRRIDAMVETKAVDLAPAAGEPSPTHTTLTVVPPADEPELPIPSPASAQPAAVALVHDLRTAAIMPEVTFVASAPPTMPTVVKKAVAAPVAPPAAAATSTAARIALPLPAAVEINEPAQQAAAAPPRIDPLAAIMALSEDERIALFT